MNELKHDFGELINIDLSKLEKENNLKLKIFKIIKEVSIEADWDDDEKMIKHFDIWIGEDEFSIYHKFGNLEYDFINRLHAAFIKHSFELYCITDTFTRNKFEKGLIFLFKKV